MAISFLELKTQDPDPVRQGIVDVITNSSVFLRRLYFIKTPTLAYRYNRQTALPGIAATFAQWNTRHRLPALISLAAKPLSRLEKSTC